RTSIQLDGNTPGILGGSSIASEDNQEKVIPRIESILDELKETQKENESLQAKLSNQQTEEILAHAKTVRDTQVLAEKVNAKDMNQLRSMLDSLKQKLESGVILLAAGNDGKVLLVSGVTNDLTKRGLHAGKMIGQAAAVCGGGGGGRPDMAQAGGKDISKIPEALETVYSYIEENLQ